MELTDEQKQDLIKFHKWVKSHPEITTIFTKYKGERYLEMKSRFSKFQLHYDVLSAIVEYGNNEFLFGLYADSKDREVTP